MSNSNRESKSGRNRQKFEALVRQVLQPFPAMADITHFFQQQDGSTLRNLSAHRKFAHLMGAHLVKRGPRVYVMQLPVTQEQP